MTSLVNTAVTAIIASLSSGTPVASQIGRVSLRPVAAAQAQSVVVRPMHSEVTERVLSGIPTGWTTALAVECYARCTADQSPDVAVDSLVEAVYARLMEDPSLGGAVLALQPQNVAYDFDSDGDRTVCATFTFTVRQRGGQSVFS